mmetsp:Transcript_10037/g.25046  ORF Transcript_10037/g.25046 Transcript_10037/m.25046 type:complete len:319 (+) Transcript_10037:44-1000(+)|eukprot:CAMPEP_0177660962 /NCGR_PEP_ID=MMETSP0447-20121125/18368_1 /TAXON_ID=0 /ORGANISM="Stygamoeba regulata, Strain BSH-02190019" /LENGTH=318 /DNA_ID=CAMNT_0019166159 /DNA_START=31 /DNA_END=987 /DNA_ORIENTATION=+
MADPICPALSETTSEWLAVPKSMLSRLLYTNPVCLLSTFCEAEQLDCEMVQDEQPHQRADEIAKTEQPGAEAQEIVQDTIVEASPHQVSTTTALCSRALMTITWLTATSNAGEFVCSLNRTRSSYALLKRVRKFVLNVPVKGMEELVRQIGSCHSAELDKYERFALDLCRPGGGPLSPTALPSADPSGLLQRDPSELSIAERKLVQHTRREVRRQAEAALLRREQDRNALALRCCVAHLVCEVTSLCEESVAGHGLFCCRITHAYVRSAYWDGKCFAPRDPTTPPYLTFFGSGRFGYVRAETETEQVKLALLLSVSGQ